MEDSDKGLFIKILPEARAESFLNGEMYFNTDKYFSMLDSKDVVRSDPDEDADESWIIKEFSIQDKESGEYVPIGGINNPVKYRYGERPQLNILCLYVLLERADFNIDERILEFGDTAIVIRNVMEFTKRIHTTANKIGLGVKQQPIEYVDKSTYHGQIGPFRKYADYAFQSEFRFLIVPGEGKPISLRIGDIRDICFAIPSKEIASLKPR